MRVCELNHQWTDCDTNSYWTFTGGSAVARSKKQFQLSSQIFHIIYSDHANVCMPKGELEVCGHWVLVQANESVHYLIEYKDIQMLIWFRLSVNFHIITQMYSCGWGFIQGDFCSIRYCASICCMWLYSTSSTCHFTQWFKKIHTELNVTIHSKENKGRDAALHVRWHLSANGWDVI